MQGPKPTPGGLLGAGPQAQVSPLSIVPPSTTDDLDHVDDVRAYCTANMRCLLMVVNVLYAQLIVVMW